MAEEFEYGVETGLDKYFPEHEDLWVEVEGNALQFLVELRDRGIIDRETFEADFDAYWSWYWQQQPEAAEEEPAEFPWTWTYPGAPPPAGTPPEKALRQEIGDALFEKQKGYFATAFSQVIESMWSWILDQLRSLIDLVVGTLAPVLVAAWDKAKDKLEDCGRDLYKGYFSIFEGHSQVRPEDATTLALKLYGVAMGLGMAAHGVATLTELAHPLKTVGLHQTAAIIGDFAGFGRLAGATIGPLVNRVLGQAMTYAVQDRYRPNIPRENLLIEFRSKREIDKAEFDMAMGYQGYSKYWTDIVERWQWKDPRMFEILRLADVGLEQGPPPAEEMGWLTRFGVTGKRLKDWWLYRKFMRAGYEDCDIPVMVRFIHRREVSFALTYVRTAIRRNYRWGYLSDEELDKWMDRLQLPEQAKEWIFWAGELDREYFYRQDLQSYYVTAYRNDVINDDELLVSLLAMNLPAREASLLVRTERIRKRPKAQANVPKEQAAPLAKIQSAYISLYREQFKKGYIEESQYLQSLLAIGLDRDLADVTVQLDATKKAPEPTA